MSDAAELIRQLGRSFASVAYLELDARGELVYANQAFASRLRVAPDTLPGRHVTTVATVADAATLERWLAGESPPAEPCLLNFVAVPDEPFTLRCHIELHGGRLLVFGETDAVEQGVTTEQLVRLNNEFAAVTRELARRTRSLERAKQELAEKLAALRTSYWHLQKIQEVMPICMGCGRVKSDGSRWESVVEYLMKNEIFLSHGYCPPCAEAVHRGLEPEDPA